MPPQGSQPTPTPETASEPAMELNPFQRFGATVYAGARELQGMASARLAGAGEFIGKSFASAADRVSEHPRAVVALLGTTTALAGGVAANTETSKANHFGTTPAEQCMDNFRSDAKRGGPITSIRSPYREGMGAGRRAIRINVFSSSISNDEYPPDNKCSRTEFYMGARSWPVVENNNGKMNRAGRAIKVPSNTYRAINTSKLLRLYRRYTCEPGPGKRRWGVKTRLTAVSRESGQRERVYQYVDGSEYSRPKILNQNFTRVISNPRPKPC